MTMNLMKPICDWGSDVVSSLHCGEMGSPNSFSLAPCLKNSLRHRSAHRTANSRGRAGFEMSHMCMTAAIIWSVESVQSSGFCPFCAISAVKSFRKTKCFDMSVLSTTWMMTRRISACCSALKAERMLISSYSFMVANTVWAWKFSWIDWSLCAMARSVSACLWNALLKPSCPRSWTMTERRRAKISISDKNFSTLQVVSMKKTPCKTSAACVQLWYSVSV
mmetsp:Transcript_33262/g.85263  ORF Transcript_33262/g.85263 Transcript_33262/m.85263 type:complete len:221 (-) Transcript_33262:1120-1782(-)